MINNKIIPRFGMAVAFSSLLLCQSFAYEEKIEEGWYANFHQNTSILNAHQELAKKPTSTSKHDLKYSVSLLGGGIGLAYKMKSNFPNRPKDSILFEVDGISSWKNKIFFDPKSEGFDDYKANLDYAGIVASAYYNIYYNEYLSFHAGGGLGVSYLMFNDITGIGGGNTKLANEARIAPTFQLKGGFSTNAISDTFTPYVSYAFRYLHGGSVTLKSAKGSQQNENSTNVKTHNIQVGVLIPLVI